jgi:hypothetical protein
MGSTLQVRSIPKLRCDFNACGWSGEAGDNCYYAMHREQLVALPPEIGTRVCIWDWSDSEVVCGCEALLELFENNWRARPVDGTWFEGKPDETFVS